MNYKQLKETILYHDYLYYTKGEPIVEDTEYDRLYDLLVNMERNQGYSDADSPTAKVGYRQGKVKHRFRLYSLKKTYDKDEFEAANWDIITRKLDGICLTLDYTMGPVRLITRGDGEFGEDVTHLLPAISGIPDTIGLDVVVVGECLTNNSVENYRNYVAGAMNSKIVSSVVDKGLCFIAHDVLNAGKDYTDRLHEIGEWGIDTVLNTELCLKYPTDGTVGRVNDMHKESELGHTSKHPKFAIALKERNALVATTIIQDIYWSVGRSGVVTPVAIIEEVEIDDAKINRVTLHNYEFVIENKLGRGDIIEIERVITPQFVKVISRSSFPRFTKADVEQQLQVPVLEQGPKLFVNSTYTVRNLEHFCKTLKINKLGPATIQKSGIKSIPELFTYDWTKFGKVGDTIISELAVEKDYATVLAALGIPGVGKNTAKLIVEALPSFSTLKNVQNIDIKGVGPVTKSNIVSWLDENEIWVYSLPSNIKLEQEVAVVDTTTETFKVCITGKLGDMTKNDMKHLLRNYGVEVIESVTKDCKMLITADDKPSLKYKAAQKNNIPIVNFQTNKERIMDGSLFIRSSD